jgi:hypothetical protein
MFRLLKMHFQKVIQLQRDAHMNMNMAYSYANAVQD